MKKIFFSLVVLVLGTASLYAECDDSYFYKKGWNIVELSSLNYKTINQVSGLSNVEYVFDYDNKYNSWNISSKKLEKDDYALLSKGKGFWVYFSDDTTISCFPVLPPFLPVDTVGEMNLIVDDKENLLGEEVSTSDTYLTEVDSTYKEESTDKKDTVKEIFYNSSYPVNQFPLSSDETAYPGQDDFLIFDFQILDEYVINNLKINLDKESEKFFSNFRIWKKEGTEYFLISSSLGKTYFKDLNLRNIFDEDARYVITADISKIDMLDYDKIIKFSGSISLDLEDYLKNSLFVKDLNFSRKIQIGKSTPVVSVEDEYSEKLILNGNSSDFIFEIKLNNVKDMELKDLLFYFEDKNGNALRTDRQIQSVSIYGPDMTKLLASEQVTGEKLFFEDFNFLCNENYSSLFIKIKTQEFGYSKAVQASKNSVVVELYKIDFENINSGDEFEKTFNNLKSLPINFINQ